MSARSYQASDLNAWLAQDFRLTAFPIEPEAALQRDFWQELMGEPAETSSRKRLLRTDQGRVGSQILTLTVDPARIELAWLPEIDVLNPPDDFPSLGTFSTALGRCPDVFRRFLSDLCPEIRRLGFGSHLIRPSDSREGCYRILDACLPDVNVDPQSHDFVYRINRRRIARSVTDGMLINRLSNWSAIKMTIASLAMGTPSGTQLRPTELQGCRLEVDINTDGERSEPLPRAFFLEIWHELVALGQEIAVQGDVP